MAEIERRSWLSSKRKSGRRRKTTPEVLTFATLCLRNVNGIVFVGSVKEKTVARNLYTQARARGKAAGIVRYWCPLQDFEPAAASLGLTMKMLFSVIVSLVTSAGLTIRKWRLSRPRSTFLRAATSSLSSTTRR